MLLSPLTTELCVSFEQTDTGGVSDGVTDAILEYAARPKSFDEARGVPLDRFLRKNAWRNIANIARGDKRRREREHTAATMMPVVELHPAAGNDLQDEVDKRIERHQRELDALSDPVDKEIQRCRQTGERRTSEFAKVLAVGDLSISEQLRAVKRAKDRIDQIVRRKLKEPDERE
jgi:hypothetical protein